MDEDACVVVPALPDSRDLSDCLRAVRDAHPDGQIVLAIDGVPTERDRRAASAVGAELLATGTRTGPSAARNLGARAARAPVVFFVDADVLLLPDAVQMACHVLRSSGADGVIGRYASRTPARGILSRLANLQHSTVHSSHEGPVSTFWGACSALRVDALLAVGGFDEGERYCEDIEIGHRLTAAGRRLVLSSALECFHLKSYTLGSWVRTQLLERALPWSRLILSGRTSAGELNTDRRGQATLLVAIAVLSAVPAALLWRPLLLIAPAGLLALLLLHPELTRMVARHEPRLLPLLAPYLLVHASLGGLGFAIALLHAGSRPAAARRPA
jgi:GT2 family glycosyltransferase